MFSRVAKDSNPGFEEDSVTRVSTSFPCSVSHVGEELGNLEVGDGVDRQQSAMFTNVKQESGNQQFNRNLSADESSVSQVKEEEGLTGEVTHAYQNPTLTQQSKRTPTILTESFLVKETWSIRTVLTLNHGIVRMSTSWMYYARGSRSR